MRSHGRKGRVYLQLLSTDVNAQPVAFLNKWSLNGSSDQTEITSFEDETKVYLAGLPDAKGAFSGFFDDATPQTYAASQDGIGRKFYLYPSVLNNSLYWFGTINADFSASGGTNQAIDVSSSWSASTPIFKVG